MPFTGPQQSQLQKILDERYEVLLEEVRDALEQSQSQQYAGLIDRMPGDAGDRSVADVLADLDLAAIDRHVQEIRDIEGARARIKEGTFGICVTCGGDIGFERLLVYPTAKRCVVCQEQRERTHVHGATPKL